MYSIIQLTRGQIAIVDPEDYERLITIGSWQAHWCKKVKSFYAQRGYKLHKRCASMSMHRTILGLTDPKVQVDHWNHNTLDNRKENLRAVNSIQNNRNKLKYRNNTSGLTGISYSATTAKYRVLMRIGGKLCHKGYFTLLQDAINVRAEILKGLLR